MHPIKDKVGFLLIQILRQQRQQAEVALNKLGLHAGQEMILLRLSEEEGITQGQLAELMQVEPPTVTKMLHRMEGLVERRPDSIDARVSRVYLTEQGRALLPGVLKVWQNLEETVLQGLTETEQLLLRRLLMQVYHNLSK